MSPVLFCLYLEPLCRRILADHGVRGFIRGGYNVKMLVYADDITLLCSDASDVRRALGHVHKFCITTGARVSWLKSHGSWLGSAHGVPGRLAGLTWSRVPPLYLGVPLDQVRSSARFWQSRVTKLKQCVQLWRAVELSVFARAFVCNVRLASCIGYYLQVLPCGRAAIHQMHRTFATYIWNSQYERTRRDNLFHCLSKGGLHLVHLFVRQLVWRVSFLRDETSPFLRHCISTFLKDELPGVVVSSVYDTPLFIWGFYKEIADTIRFLAARFSYDFIFQSSRRMLYWAIIDSVFPPPLYRQRFGPGPGEDILGRVKKMPVEARVKDFFFRLHTGTLPVRVWLRERGFFVAFNTCNCKLCPVEETIEHVFLECRDAIFFWDIFQRTFKKNIYLCPRSLRFLPLRPGSDLPWDTLILLGLYSLWVARSIRDRNDPPVCSWDFFRRYSVSLCTYLLSRTGCMADSCWFLVLERMMPSRPDS